MTQFDNDTIPILEDYLIVYKDTKRTTGENKMRPEIDYKRLWEGFSLSEMLFHSALYLDWSDGYEKYEEGSHLAILGDYELDYNDEYNEWVIKNLKSNKIIYRHNYGGKDGYLEPVLCIILNERIGGREFNVLWYPKEPFIEVLLNLIKQEEEAQEA
jgi:hypothetical protein